MTPNEEHVSMFELDLYFAVGASDARVDDDPGQRDPGQRDPGQDRRIQVHVAACERCSAYLTRLAALQRSAPLPVAPEAPPARRVRPRALGLTLAELAVAGMVAALLVVTHDTEPPAVAVKGSPAVQLLVRRGNETLPWDGLRRVRPGDALGLRVACEGFRHVAVAGGAGLTPVRWSSLSTGECPPAVGVLPFTLVVDDEPGRERLAVVFSRSVLDARRLEEAIEQRRVDADVWVTRFDLAKEDAP